MKKSSISAMKYKIENLLEEHKKLIKINKTKIPDYYLCENYFQITEDILKKGSKKTRKTRKKYFSDYNSDDCDSDDYDSNGFISDNYDSGEDECHRHYDDLGQEMIIKRYFGDKEYFKKLNYECNELKDGFRYFITTYDIDYEIVRPSIRKSCLKSENMVSTKLMTQNNNLKRKIKQYKNFFYDPDKELKEQQDINNKLEE